MGKRWTDVAIVKTKTPLYATPKMIKLGKIKRGKISSQNTNLTRSHVSSYEEIGDRFTKKNNLDFLKDITVDVHYEMYDGIPLISKYISIHNRSHIPVTVNKFIVEYLSAVEGASLGSSLNQRKWLLTQYNGGDRS